MQAAIYHQFKGPITIEDVPIPDCPMQGVVLKVGATGICRSDWHGWMGHDSDIRLPHVPGHELSGTVATVGKEVKNWHPGDRVTLPFVCGCGSCPECASGNHQVCDNQFQPGFTAWGSFAEYVAIDYADINLVHLPNEIDFVTAASLGCRFITSFRAVVDQGKVSAGQWVAVHGCGGVGLSAIMIARSIGARVIAIDISDSNLELAQSLGADFLVNAREVKNVVDAIKEVSGRGVHVSVDALGSSETSFNSIAGLRKRGKHIQVGLMTGGHRHAAIPFDLVVANELEVIGSHGMQAFRYPEIFEMIKSRKLQPEKLVQKKVTLEEGIQELIHMNNFEHKGISVIEF